MPTIAQARANNAARIAAGGQTGVNPGSAALVAAPTPQQDLPISQAPQRGMFAADLVLASDRSDSSRVFRGAGMRSATFPYQPQQIKTSETIAGVSTVVSSSKSSSASSLALETNSLANPNQDLLNLVEGANITIVANPDGSVVITAATATENAFELIDNFHGVSGDNSLSGTSQTAGIGELGWGLFGTVGGQGGVLGGTFPNVGLYGWSNSATASQAGWLTLNGSGSFSDAAFSQLSWGIADTPGAYATFVFKVDTGAPLNSSPNFSVAKTAIYVGFTGPNINGFSGTPVSRPPIFIGVRYDTSTTSPSINDSFFTLEVVLNKITSFDGETRNNTQGTTLVTDITPTQGVWHTLTVDFTVAGSVTLILDGTATLTAAIPTQTVSGTIDALAQNGAARLNWSVASATPQSVWQTGTSLTVSGFTSSLAALNGTWELTASSEEDVGFDAPGVTTSGSGTATLEGYPALTPFFMMGNDDSSSPTLNARMFVADYFSIIWNSES